MIAKTAFLLLTSFFTNAIKDVDRVVFLIFWEPL